MPEASSWTGYETFAANWSEFAAKNILGVSIDLSLYPKKK